MIRSVQWRKKNKKIFLLSFYLPSAGALLSVGFSLSLRRPSPWLLLKKEGQIIERKRKGIS
jgi:hypothetical protein